MKMSAILANEGKCCDNWKRKTITSLIDWDWKDKIYRKKKISASWPFRNKITTPHQFLKDNLKMQNKIKKLTNMT